MYTNHINRNKRFKQLIPTRNIRATPRVDGKYAFLIHCLTSATRRSLFFPLSRFPSSRSNNAVEREGKGRDGENIQVVARYGNGICTPASPCRPKANSVLEGFRKSSKLTQAPSCGPGVEALLQCTLVGS